MSIVTFADVASPSVSFSTEHENEALVLELIDTKWFQRLRGISQTANTRLVYMFSEHSRFGHSVGVAHLATSLMKKLARTTPNEIQKYSLAVSAAALLHDVGHIAPGSHTAYKTWFPTTKDIHEEVGCRIIREDTELNKIFAKYSSELPETICSILQETESVPPWTWQVISGGGWNADRGNWCIVDSILAGVSYGEYNVAALTDSMCLTSDGNLALKENRLDAMMHFALSRHAMYRQVYQHRVLMSSDRINWAIAKRARALGSALEFADDVMKDVLAVDSPEHLSLDDIFSMQESWWLYHLSKWQHSKDKILSDLCQRLLYRDLFKTIRIRPDEDTDKLYAHATKAVQDAGFDPEYYLHRCDLSFMHQGDYQQSMLVQMDDGSLQPMVEAEPLFEALLKETNEPPKSWLAMPAEAKALLGRPR